MKTRTMIAVFVIAFVWFSAASRNVMGQVEITCLEVSSDVVCNVTGSANFTGLTAAGSNFSGAEVRTDIGRIVLGPTTSTNFFIRSGASGPTSFGTSSVTIPASTGSGDIVGVQGNGSVLFFPTSYTGGSPLSGTATWNIATYASLGMTPGVYDWTWGAGGPAQRLSVIIPEPSGLLLVGFGVFGLLLRKTR